MAARRLVAVLLILLFLSSLAAALAPPIDREGDETSTTETTQTVPAAPNSAAGELVEARIDAEAGDPQVVRARVGDQLQLEVKADRVASVELHGLGPTEDVGPLSPARFDVLLTHPGEFQVRFLEDRKRIGSIRVAEAR